MTLHMINAKRGGDDGEWLITLYDDKTNKIIIKTVVSEKLLTKSMTIKPDFKRILKGL